MDAPHSHHPSDQTLKDYGLGKLEDELASTVNGHLEGCPDCRRRVAGLTSDSFLGRFREAQKPPAMSIPGGSLDAGTISFMPAKVPSPPPSADTLPPGLADHPDYEIRRELGRGGMGVVYLAHNTLMGRDEVLKVMGRHILERPGALERFQREIRAVANLRHPNIVAAHSAFRIEGGLVFAMEYVEGLDLARLVKAKGPLPVTHAAYFIHQAALGLQHAHERGMIHRDIKPHNLMLTSEGKARLVKVLDFGLAKANREQKVDGGLTSEGQALGTPDYIAPEQIMSAVDVDIRADLYSLGGTLFYLLTGRPPFRGNTLYDIYQAHISRDADPLNLIRPEVPAELAALVAKMMAKDPKRRFEAPGEVALALTPYFKTKAAKAQPEVSIEAPLQAKPIGIVEKLAPTEPAANPSMVRWDQLIDVREQETIQDIPVAVKPPRRPRWLWPAVSTASLLGVLLIVWWAGVFKVNTPDGVIVLENVPKDAEIMVDGKKIRFNWPGDDKPLEIRAVPGEHKLEVTKDGFKTFGANLTFKRQGSDEVAVRLEPLVADRPRNREVEVTDTAKTGENVKSLGPSVPDYLQPGSVWVTDPRSNKFTILERRGEKFRALFEVGKQIREVNGTIKAGWIRWHSRDVRVIAGRSPGGDNQGEIQGEVIAMTWSNPGGPILENFTLRLTRSAGGAPIAEKTLETLETLAAEKRLATKPTIDGGTWTIEGDELVQSDDRGGAGLFFGEVDWSDYDLSLEAQRVSGLGHGLQINFHRLNSQSQRQFGLGVFENKGRELSFCHIGKWSRKGDTHDDNWEWKGIDDGRWYFIKLKVRKSKMECYLDNELLSEESHSFFHTAGSG